MADTAPYEPMNDDDFKQQNQEGIQDRIGFVKKVYGILSAQLTFTAAFVLVVMNISVTE